MAVTTSIFSWHKEPLEEAEKTGRFLAENQIDHLYQMISPEDSPQRIRHFLHTAAMHGVSVYFLIGEAEWALDPVAKETVRVLEEMSLYQEMVKGIVVDIEPHTLEAFKENPQRVMGFFVKALDTIYNKIREKGLEVVVCLPYYLDTMGFTSELEQIIKGASDTVALMNYYRGQERAHMQTEAQLIQKHGKSLVTIYELQPPGTYDLTDKNTYYNYGLKAARENFKQLKHAYPSLDLHLSFHELRYFMALAEKEKRDDKWQDF